MSLKDYPLLSDWLTLKDGRLYVRTGKVDIGQRISTALVGIVRQELTLPSDAIEVETVRTDHSPDEGMTSGSNSIEQSGYALRHAAATLRKAATNMALAHIGGRPEDLRLEDGAFHAPGSNLPLSILDLAVEVDFGQPVEESAPLMPQTDGVGFPMRGLTELVRGTYRFLHDLDVPNMLHARVARPPHARAWLEDVDTKTVEALESSGIKVIRDGSFLAVAGPREWPVIRAAQRLSGACRWNVTESLPEGDVFNLLTRENATPLAVIDGSPRTDAPVPEPLRDVDVCARYERPFTMHGALGPSAAMAVWDGTKLEITSHSQGIYILRESIAESLDLALENVVISYMPGSGCYGHNGADDAAYEAALLAMALQGSTVLLKWTRDDEHAWEPYGPASAVELSAKLGTDGRLAAFSAEAIGGTFRGRPRSGPDRAGPAKLLANHYREAFVGPQPGAPNMNRQGGLHRNLNPIYDIPETRFVKNLVTQMPLRTSALRCLGAALNVFGIESFIDEIAQQAGQDAIEYRRSHLTDPRALSLLDRLEATLSRHPKAEGCGRGIAYGQYKNAMTRVAVAVDLTVNDAAEIKLETAWIAADAGRVVDRDGLIAQLEGGFLQAASWALHEAVTWDRDGVTSRDWDSYRVLRFPEVPAIHTNLIERPGDPSVGAGEASPGPTLAAIANAVYDATGLRIRRLPFTPDALTAAALAT